MSPRPENNPNSKAADLTADSEEFVLPKAPPLPQPGKIRHFASSQDVNPALLSAEESTGDGASASTLPSTSQDLRSKVPPRKPHESPMQETGLGKSSRTEAPEVDGEVPPVACANNSDYGRNGLIALIIFLLAVIVVLLAFNQKESPKQTTINPVVPVAIPTRIAEEENEIRRENEKMSSQLLEMTSQNKNLKEQVRALSNARDKAVSDLGRASEASGKEATALRAEVARLETLVRNSRPAQDTKSAVREPIPEPQVAGAIYRVSGLREGDTLNVRSGPGSGFSVVTQLHPGVRVTVTGDGVANEADWWLPCILSGQAADPAAGVSKPWTAKGWVNSAFLEEEE